RAKHCVCAAHWRERWGRLPRCSSWARVLRRAEGARLPQLRANVTTVSPPKPARPAQGINLVPLAEVPPALKLYPDGRESASKLPYERAADLPMAVKDTE